MSFVKSPKVEYAPDGRPPERENRRHILLRAGIILAFLVGLTLNVYAFWAGDVVNVVAGANGTVHGAVVDAQGNPINGAEITLAVNADNQAFTAQDGAFTLTNAPVGDHYLIVVHQGVGQGFVVRIATNAVTQVGTLTYTAKPAYWQ